MKKSSGALTSRTISGNVPRVSFALALFLLTPGFSRPGKPIAGRADSRRTSVLLITLDTTRPDRLGCYGAAGNPTPNLDALAASGIRFDDAWTPVPVTLPSHTTMMTGCYPIVHGVRDNGDTRYDGRIPTLARRFTGAGYKTAAVVSASVLDSVWGLTDGFEIYLDRLDEGGETRADRTADRALDLIASLPRPFFLWVHFYDAHWKYDPPPAFAARYERDPYQGEIAFVDSQVGRLVEALKRKGEPVVVVAVGDHAEALREHGEKTHGILTYRSTLRVPLLVSGPGIPAGRTFGSPVSLIDLAPTLAEMTGLPAAKIQDGVSLAPVLRGTASSPGAPRWLYYESLLPFNSFGWVPPRGATDGKYAFIELPKRELYDLRSDPSEAKNLYVDGDSLSGQVARRFEMVSNALAQRAGQGQPVPPSEEERRRLASLGYLTGLSSHTGTPTLDPKDVIDIAEKVDDAKEHHAAGRETEALAVADAVLQRNPENVPALSIRGQAYLSMKRYREAVSTFRKALERNGNIAVLRFDLGSSLAGLGSDALAEEEWNAAIRIDPHFAEPRASLLSTRLERKDIPGAIRIAKEAISSGARSAELEFEIGLAFATSGDLKTARAHFKEAVVLRPGYVEALANLGQIDYSEKRIDEAISDFRQAIRSSGGQSHLRKTLAAILLDERHDLPGALTEFRAALEVEPDPEERERLRSLISELDRAQAEARH